MAKAAAHHWEFKSRFRRHAFGWRSQPAITRVKQAVAEIKKVARKDPALAAEGAISFLERLSPAFEQVDSSSGSLGTAVRHAIAELAPIVAGATADAATREAWLERLYAAHDADRIPYLESLADYFGELCASRELASAWADRLLGPTRLAPSFSRRGASPPCAARCRQGRARRPGRARSRRRSTGRSRRATRGSSARSSWW